MKLIKHMEAAFVIALGFAGAVAALPDLPSKEHARVAVASAGPAVPSVVVAAKRMTAEQKQQSLRDEARLAADDSSKRSRI